MQTEYIESKPVEITVQTKPLRYGEHRPLRLAEYCQALRGRQMFIDYTKDKATYRKVIACPLAVEDTLNIGLEKIRKALLDNKLSLSDVVNVTVNHSIGHEACKAIVRRAIASRS